MQVCTSLSARQAVAAGAVLHRAGQPAAAHEASVAELGDVNNFYWASDIRDNSARGADVSSGAVAADEYPEDPPPRARREESHARTHAHTQSHTPTHPHTHTQTHTRTHKRAHLHTHTHTHTDLQEF